MSELLLKVLPLGVFGSLLAVLTAGFSPAQEPISSVPPGAPVPRPDPAPLPLPLPGQPGLPAAPAQPDPNVQPAQGEGVEVLAKGPVHEAFATTAEAPTASPVVVKQPPEAIEELPPDQKPAGDNVQWIPGYWHWDEEASKFIWISGFWRQPPPGRVWVSGAWREAKGGWQWVSGFWQEVRPQAAQPDQPVQPEIEYLPQPPENIEVGPTVPAPGEGYFYTPGSWVWRNKYVWRPGVWVEYRTNWLWVPARYHWTPAGHVFCDGYWDYPLATRGVLFAPVAFLQPPPPAFVYTPAYVVSEPCMVGALFVRRGHGNYYFGDYFDPGYGTLGYSAWCGTYSRAGFSVGFGVGRSWGYDPLWSYYSQSYRNTPTWHRGVGDLYHGRYRGDLVRPPVTLVQQNTVINNITRVNVTNVTNNLTVNRGVTTVNNRDVSNVAMVAPLRVAGDLQQTRFEPVNAQSRRNEAGAARQLRDVGTQRTRLETAAAAQQPQQQPFRPAPGQPGDRPGVAAAQQPPRSIKLDVPRGAVARAQVGDGQKGPPPNPVRPANAGPGAKIDGPRIEPKSPGQPFTPPGNAQPKFDPKLPGANPQPGPGAKIDPPRVNPPSGPGAKIDPPRVNPQPPAVGNPAPKVNPQPFVPKADPPRANPQPPVNPGNPQPFVPKVDPRPAPKVEPPRANPQPFVPKGEAPKVDPRPAPKVDPRPAPKLEAPRVNPQPPVVAPPRVEPKVNPQPFVPKVDPRPAPKVEAPRVNPQPAPKVNPQPAPRVEPPKQAPIIAPPRANPQPPPAPKGNPQPAPRFEPPKPAPAPPRANPQPPPPAPKINPQPAPRANPQPVPRANPQPVPRANPQPPPKRPAAPVAAPRANPQPAPVVAAPKVQPQPRPAPAAQPQRPAFKPPAPAAQAPKVQPKPAQPAAPARPPAKKR